MNDTQSNPRPGRLKRFRTWLFSWRTLRRTLVALAGLITLLTVCYTIENWRGQRAWEKCKRDLTAAGYELDWSELIPPPVPADQNIFNAPHLQEWFARQSFLSADGARQRATSSNFLSTLNHPHLALFGKESRITNVAAATEFLEWSRQFEPEFDQIRTALQRPYARMEGDYTRPYEIPIPNFVALRSLAQTFAQRAHCHLLLNQPAEALADLTFIHATRKLLLGQPTGKPMTLVAAMIHVAITGLYTGRIEEGLQARIWQEPQLLALESQLAELNLPEPVYEGLRCELTATTHTFQTEPFHKLLAMSQVVTKSSPKSGFRQSWWDRLKGLKLRVYNLAPRGWLYQNLAVHASLERMILESIQGCQTNMRPIEINTASDRLQTEFERTSLFNLIAKVAIPHFHKALLTTTKNQTAVNQARIACALERYHLAHGRYPDSLSPLQPQFLSIIPSDLIGNQPLKYRRAPDDSFVLYSVAWNVTDDGGVTATDAEKGDWVWRYPAQ